jgi:subtilisin family serine protease
MGPAQTLSGQPAATPAERPAQLFDSKSLLMRFKTGTAPELKAQARGQIKGRLLRAYTLIPGLEQVSIGEPGLDVDKVIEILKRLPFVDYAQRNHVIFASATFPNDEYFPEQWALHNTGQDSMFGVWLGGIPDADVDAPEAWDTTTTSNTVVAIIDTGITWGHPDLDGNVWTNPGEIANNNIDDDGNGYVDDVRGWDFANGDNDPWDGHGHGSHVAGVVAAEGNNSIGVTGVMWQGKVMALKALADNGTGYLADAIAALQYAVAKGAKVSNNSWGYYGSTEAGHQALYDAIAAARAGNHLFVAAAGNDGLDNDAPSASHYPSSFDLDNIIAVAATDNSDLLSSFSNYGATTVDLGAPGSDIFSTWTVTCFFSLCDYDYAWLSGTSMATPHVAAVAALVYGRHPDWSYGQVRDRVLTSARPVPALAGITVAGGVVNALNALQESGTPPNTPPLASFTSVCGGFTCDFNGSGSSDSDGTLASYAWDFGDGDTGSGVTASHSYAASGTYNVTLTVTDNAGATDTETKPVTVITDTGLRSPSANAPVTISAGDNNGFEVSAANAYADDGAFAVDNNGGTGSSTTCTHIRRDKHLYYNYDFPIPVGKAIKGVEVRLDAKVDSSSGSPKMCVQLSWNGGATWTKAKSTPTLTTGEATYILGGASDAWGRTWSAGEFSNANFRLRVIDVANSTVRDFFLDYVAVKVTFQ